MPTPEIFKRVFKLVLGPDYAENVWVSLTPEQKQEFEDVIREIAAEIIFTKPPEE